MSLAGQINTLVTRIGTEFKTVYGQVGVLANLQTTAKGNLVAAINEVKAATASATAINDGTTTTTTTWSSSKINTQLGLKANTASLATVATTGAYADILGKPTLAPVATSGVYTDLTGRPTLSTVATTGAYADLTGKPTLGTAAAQPTTAFEPAGAAAAAQSAAQAYSDGLLDANNAMVFKGAIDCSTNPNYPAANAGHTYKVSVAGRIGGAGGVVVEVGDTLYCLVDGSAAGTQAAVGANWNIVQSNLDGAVVGPAASTASDFAMFSGATGKVLQDTGLSFDTDAALAANSNTRVPSQAAVRAYTYSQTQIGDPASDFVTTFNAALV